MLWVLWQLWKDLFLSWHWDGLHEKKFTYSKNKTNPERIERVNYVHSLHSISSLPLSQTALYNLLSNKFIKQINTSINPHTFSSKQKWTKDNENNYLVNCLTHLSVDWNVKHAQRVRKHCHLIFILKILCWFTILRTTTTKKNNHLTHR